MSRKQFKFVLGPVVIVLTLAWIAFSAFNETKAYYQTISELYAMEDSLDGKRLRVMGEVVPGTIDRQSNRMDFVITDTEDGQTLRVQYVGRDPIPDTFRDYAEAVVDGEYAGDGVFIGTKLQAKCASKYERELEAGVNPETTQLEIPRTVVESEF